MRDPGFDGLKRPWLDPAGADPTGFVGDDEPALLKDLNVLHDCGERHGQRFGEFADRRLAQSETFDDGAPGRVGEGVEDTVERRLMVKHSLDHRGVPENSQEFT